MAKALANLVSKLITPLCQKSGFVKASLVIDWDKIVGPKFSQFCEAVRVNFPQGKKNQGSLYIRVPSAMATHIAFLEPEILEKVNRYYGYPAISRVIIQQGPVMRKSSPPPKTSPSLTQEKREEILNLVSEVGDESLQKALERLGSSIFERNLS